MPFAAKENELFIGGKRHSVNTQNDMWHCATDVEGPRKGMKQ